MRMTILLCCFVLLGGCGHKGGPVSYQRDLQPLIANRCVPCHNSNMRSGNIVLTSYDSVMAARTTKGKKPIVVAGQPNDSWLYLLGATKQAHFRMPPDTSTLTPFSDDEVRLVGRWIQQGAGNN